MELSILFGYHRGSSRDHTLEILEGFCDLCLLGFRQLMHEFRLVWEVGGGPGHRALEYFGPSSRNFLFEPPSGDASYRAGEVLGFVRGIFEIRVLFLSLYSGDFEFVEPLFFT